MMELLQEITTGEFGIYVDGHEASNPGVYYDRTNSLGFWANKGLQLSDSKVVKKEVKRIVNLETGADLDEKFSNLQNDNLKRDAARHLVFDLLPATCLTVLSQAEYDEAILFRKTQSRLARESRFDTMVQSLSVPEVLAEPIKVAMLVNQMRLYKDDYIFADNKIMEAFILGVDHAFDQAPGFNREVDFGSNSDIALPTLKITDNIISQDVYLWYNDPQNPTQDETDYFNLVYGIVKGVIVDGEHFIIE